MKNHSVTVFIPMLASILIAMSTPSIAQDFPDDHFFNGAERSAGLKSLEGKPAPALALDAWIGDETSLEKLRGKVVVVDFWATWCGPCMAAIPKNIELVKKHEKDGLAFIGVHDSRSGWDRAASVVSETGINYPVARDAAGASVKSYNLGFWPTYVVIDRKGVVRAAGLLPDKVGPVVEKLLAEPGGPGASAGSTAEFPIDWFVGGSKRLPGLARTEGRPAPKLEATEWIGTPPEADALEGRVTVLRFVSPVSRRVRTAMPEWRRTTEQLAPQGVVFLGVCDHLADWKRMRTMLGEAGPPFPIARDLPPEESGLPLGRLASSYGIRGWPTTVIIDRNGRVRAAGIDDARVAEVVGRLLAEPIESSAGDS